MSAPQERLGNAVEPCEEKEKERDEGGARVLI